jgi:uncharacterized membrane protein (GlpM family)
MDNKMLLVAYFVIGGVVVSAITYLGSHSKSMLAAFIALLPCVSVITLCTIYFSSGTGAVVSYAKNMLILLPPWILYVVGVIYLLPRIGLARGEHWSLSSNSIIDYEVHIEYLDEEFDSELLVGVSGFEPPTSWSQSKV